jgi:hypothetical protein
LFKDEKEYTKPPTPLQNVYIISDEAQNLFTNPDLMAFIMKNSFDLDSYYDAICHICFNDYKLSKHYSKYLL